MTPLRSPLSETADQPAVPHPQMANAIRALAMDAVQAANSGHPGKPMGSADIATVLFSQFLRFDPERPDWPDRDRFVLSAGHASMLLYALLHLTGYPDMSIDQIKAFRQLGSRTAGHPEYGASPGIETTTGPLGQGLANAVGMAMAEQLLAARFGADLVDHHTYALVGDGCLMEGISHEAASLAGHLRLSKLIVLFDDNGISIDGPTSLAVCDKNVERFAAYGWATQAIDGHDPEAIAAALERAQGEDRPSFIACKTVIGFGAPTKAGTAKTHGSPLGEEEILGAREQLGWPHAAFEIPEDVLSAWRAVGGRGSELARQWDARLAAAEPERRRDFLDQQAGKLPADLSQALNDLKTKIAEERPKLATRVSSQQVLDCIAPLMPFLVGGSADLTGSNNTKASCQAVIAPDDFSGSYVHYGVREHGMAAAMNGMALHRGVIPYGGTFLVFTDYLRPALRLSALMEQRVIYVMTHDSIGLGEDGPTHQPVEHLASLRAMPNLFVFRPCDTIETAECWELALHAEDSPSVLVLSRQAMPTLRGHDGENYCAYGAYIMTPAQSERQVTLIASGSEVEVAVKARELLEGQGISSAVVSAPCWELFDQQPQHYRDEVLGPGALHVAIEAGVSLGWERYIEGGGAFVGMRGFGASAPAKDLFAHFKITPEAVVEAVKARL